MNFEKARSLMVINQLKPNKIDNLDILELFENTPKELFLPEEKKLMAYIDDEISISKNRSYLSNLHIAQMLQHADLRRSEHVLHIGSLTGYVTTLISKLVSSVVAVEEDKNLYKIIDKNIILNKINNIHLVNNKYEDGFIERKPYNVIFIDGIVESISDKILDQLNDENGRLITIEKVEENLGKGIKLTKNKNFYYKKIIFDSFSKSCVGFKKDIKFKF